jgi:hypothetical protein
LLFNSDLLVVQIPATMVKSYARKLETIRVMSLSEAMASKTSKFHRPSNYKQPKTPRSGKLSKVRFFSISDELDPIGEENDLQYSNEKS